MKYTIILPAMIAFAISAVLCPVIIPFLHKLKFGQFIRDEGPESHQKKSGTPTMGGVIFIVSVILTSLFYMRIIRRLFRWLLPHLVSELSVLWMTISKLSKSVISG